MPESQPMLGLVLEPTIAIRRGEAYVVQCTGCGCLLAVAEGPRVRPPHQLGPCPVCQRTGGSTMQLIPVGPFTAEWAHYLVGAAVAVVRAPTSKRDDRVKALRRAIEHARLSTRESRPWLARRLEATS